MNLSNEEKKAQILTRKKREINISIKYIKKIFRMHIEIIIMISEPLQ